MYFLAFLPILSVMMVVHELGHFITARWFGITVQEFGLGLPPRLWGFERGGVIYSINLIPFGAFVKMLGEEDPSAPGSFASKPRWVRGVVLAAGSGMNFMLAVLAFAAAMMVGLPSVQPDRPASIAEVVPGSPADEAGLRAGDTVIAVDGTSVDTMQFRQLMQDRAGEPAVLTLERGADRVTTTVMPRADPPEGQGALGVRIGANYLLQYAPPRALAEGFQQSARAVGLTLAVPKLLMEGAIQPSEARPIGLPGMAQLTAQAVDFAVDTGLWYPLFMLTGMFSAGLSVANMLPIPALDGGRFFFVVLEWIRGRRIPPEREAAFHLAGIVLLLTLMVVVSLNDLLAPIPQVNWGFR